MDGMLSFCSLKVLNKHLIISHAGPSVKNDAILAQQHTTVMCTAHLFRVKKTKENPSAITWMSVSLFYVVKGLMCLQVPKDKE